MTVVEGILSKYSANGFSLIELVAVIVIVGVLAITISVRYSNNNIQLIHSQSDVMAALRHARQIALARAESDTQVVVIALPNSIDLQENAASIRFSGTQYPLIFPSGITLTQGRGRFVFDRLGSTRSDIIQLTDGNSTQQITVAGSGYVY